MRDEERLDIIANGKENQREKRKKNGGNIYIM